MAVWYAVKRRFVLRTCEAPDKRTATARLRPDAGERVVSRASHEIDGAWGGLCGTCRARYVGPRAIECEMCARARTEKDEGVPELPSAASKATLDGKPLRWDERARIVATLPAEPKADRRRRPMPEAQKALLSALLRGRPLAPDHPCRTTNAIRNAKPWSAARRQAVSDGQRKRMAAMSDAEKSARSAKMNAARWGNRQPKGGAMTEDDVRGTPCADDGPHEGEDARIERLARHLYRVEPWPGDGMADYRIRARQYLDAAEGR